MKLLRALSLTGGVSTLTIAAWAASPSPQFNYKVATLPPLSLADLTRQPSPALAFSNDRKAAQSNLPRANQPERVSSDSRWPMPVIKPDETIDYKMAVIAPDQAVDYKLEIKPPAGGDPPPANR